MNNKIWLLYKPIRKCVNFVPKMYSLHAISLYRQNVNLLSVSINTYECNTYLQVRITCMYHTLGVESVDTPTYSSKFGRVLNSLQATDVYFGTFFTKRFFLVLIPRVHFVTEKHFNELIVVSWFYSNLEFWYPPIKIVSDWTFLWHDAELECSQK